MSSSPEGGSPRYLGRALTELVFLLGTSLGLWLAVTRGHAFLLQALPAGPDATQHLNAIVSIGMPGSIPMPGWRSPAYGWLVSHLGVGWRYVDAAVIISSLSTCSVILSAALIGRLVARPWVGGVAAFTAALAPPLVEASTWTSPYPLLAGLGALCLLGATLFSIRGAWGGWALAALTGALALAVDPRALPVTAGAVLVVAMARGSRRRAVLAALALVGLHALCVPANRRLSQQHHVQAAGIAQIITAQRNVVLAEMASGVSGGEVILDETVVRECTGTPPVRFDAEVFLSPCGSAFAVANERQLMGRGLLPAGWWWLPGLLLLLPGRDGWRDVGRALGAVALPLAGLFLMAHATWLYPRYLLEFDLSIALLLPWALSRLAERLPRTQWVAGAACAVVLARVWPAGWPEPVAGPNPYSWAAPELVQHLRKEVGPFDRLYDCSGQGVERLWAPRALRLAGTHSMEGAIEGCAAYVRDPEPGTGVRWLITSTTSADLLDPAAHGWVGDLELYGRKGMSTWRYVGPP